MKSCITVIDLFNNTVKEHGDKTAVIFEDRRMSYSEMDIVTDAIAGKILQMGGKHGGVVSVLVPRNEYTVIGAVAAMKAGMAYLPIEDTLPAKRINYIIQDSGTNVILTTEAMLPLIDSTIPRVLLPENSEELKTWEKINKDNLPVLDREDLALLLYTSGTTGNPKGAMIPHRAPVSLIKYTVETYSITSDDVMGIYASYGFDAFPFCMLTALASGAACCIVPQRMKHDMKELYAYYYNNKVTLTMLPTAVAFPYMRNHDRGYMRVITVGGEKMPAMRICWEGCRVNNDYGPTETFAFCTEYVVQGNENEVPIGKAVAENVIYILSESGEKVADGEIGEIVIAGPQVGKGYINHPELTEKVFSPNPWGVGDYATLYHTGDMGYVREDGNIMIIGRKDKQIKIRGNRLEPGEVENVISLYPGVEDVVVNASELPNGNKVLVAYVTSNVKINGENVVEFVTERCPYYMVPSAVVQLDEIPLNYNGKVDYAHLPMPEITRSQRYTAPRTELEKVLCEAFEVCFGMEKVSIYDEFEEIGGDSLSLMMLLERCSNLGLTGAMVLNNGTPRKIAEALSSVSVEDELVCNEDYTSIYGIQWIYYDLCESVPNNMFLHVEKGLKIGDEIDAERLHDAICAAINNHVGLKARFRRNPEGKPCMYRNDEEEPQVQMIEAKEEDMDRVKEEFMTPYHLADECPYHIAIVVTEKSKYLLLDFHHFIMDGVSLALFLHDVGKAYKGEKLESETWTAFDVARNEYRLSQSSAYGASKKWYEETFAHLTCDRVPTGDAGRDNEEVTVGRLLVPLGIKKKELAEACKRLNTSEAILTEAAYALLLGKYTNSQDALFVTVFSGRDTPRKQLTVGALVKAEPVYCKWDDSTTVVELTRQLKHLRLLCMANNAFPMESLEISPRLNTKNFFLYQADIDDLSNFCGYHASAFTIRGDEAYYALLNEIWSDSTGTELCYSMIYKSNIYTEEFARQYIEDYKKILKEIIFGSEK